jgi:hypothetical protein
MIIKLPLIERIKVREGPKFQSGAVVSSVLMQQGHLIVSLTDFLPKQGG